MGGDDIDVLVGKEFAANFSRSDILGTDYFVTFHSEWNDGVSDHLSGGAGHDEILIASNSHPSGTFEHPDGIRAPDDLFTLLGDIDYIDGSDGDYTAHLQFEGQWDNDYFSFSTSSLSTAIGTGGSLIELGQSRISDDGVWYDGGGRDVLGVRTDVSGIGTALLIVGPGSSQGQNIFAGVTGVLTRSLGDSSGSWIIIGGDAGGGAQNRTAALSQETLYGGNTDDSIYGMGGADLIDVGSYAGGIDFVDGGSGVDTVDYSHVSTSLVISLSDPNSGVEGTASGLGSGNDDMLANVENVFCGSGNDTVSGTAETNVLQGNAGNDTLNGGLGSDELIGGFGDDTYYIDVLSDLITENSNEGTDTVCSAVSLTLGSNLEGLVLLSGAVFGNGNDLNNVLTGNAAANTLNGEAGADLMTGGAGNDIYVVDDAGDATTEAANGGTDTVHSSINWTLSSQLENLTLTGTAAINGTGNSVANVLTGNSAANTLNGGAGADTMVGGTGNDIYVVDDTGDATTEAASGGTDTVQASIAWTLAAEVENLTLTGTAAINGTGNSVSNVLTGNSAANTLNGGAGADTMVGGTGNDIYVIDNTGDVTTEAASGGTDTVQASIAWTLATEVENLTLTGTSAINGTGNALSNVLTGNSAANTLNGGAGADTMVGGTGNDIYVVDNTGDATTEAASGGTDTVQASIAWTLAAEVENLTLTGTVAINGTGNSVSNVLTGNSAANTLNGGAGNDTLNGGTGSDTLIGGSGNDIYIVNSTGDVITELAGEGTDTVQSSITHTLGTDLERLTLTGTAAINGTGNDVSNILTGNTGNNTLTANAGNDTLNGGGGTDTMIGGTGNDVYVVDDTTDVITEAAGGGTDTVQSSISYSIAALSNLERITLTGTVNINAIGNSSANILTGNSGANTLNADAGNDTLQGGLGNDSLTGGSGIDTFIFATGNDADTITDFDATGTDHDIINLSGLTTITSYSDLTTSHMTQSGANVVIDGLNGDTITIKNVTVASLVSADFVF